MKTYILDIENRIKLSSYKSELAILFDKSALEIAWKEAMIAGFLEESKWINELINQLIKMLMEFK